MFDNGSKLLEPDVYVSFNACNITFGITGLRKTDTCKTKANVFHKI